jgi:DNA helicase IV
MPKCVDYSGQGALLSKGSYDAELQAERERIAFLYAHLDSERSTASGKLDGVLLDSTAETTEALWERDVAATTLSRRIGVLRIADNGLCFGRLDDTGGETTYIGRIGLFDEDNDYEPLLVDWRAPVARPFYVATAANPEGLTRRRHFRTRGRRVLGFHDDVLEHGVADSDEALLAALNAPRSDTMGDIVATIQAEQDEIIRLGRTGVVVIDGGPGTGKTVVALHRVAYLLYTHRERMSRRGVLIIGPNTGFLRYIGGVLPSLGETDVVFATPGELLPDVKTRRTDPDRDVKGSLRMVDLIRAAVANRQELPATPIEIELDDVTVEIDDFVAAKARDRARTSGRLHNRAQEIFRDALLLELAEQAVDRIGADWLDVRDTPELAGDLGADVRRELFSSEALDAAVELLWPRLSARRLLADLYTSPERLAAIGAPKSFHRARGDAWTVSDVPLLDEAAELLGAYESDEEAEQTQREQEAYARGVLDILDTEEDPDGELLRAVDILDPTQLAERQEERDHRSLAERAAADREWTYGHVVVDEAQELSEMDWRALMRRCPSRSMTIVGDLAQRESPAGARSWANMLDEYVPRRWVYRQLTINYRMPAEIMDVAASLLSTMDATVQPPKSVRSTGVWPWARWSARDRLAEAVTEMVARMEEEIGEGSVAVIAPDGSTLNVDALLLPPRATKGLEFDGVIVVEPATIMAGPAGPADLYVALTRATQRLGVVHSEPLPECLMLLDDVTP